VVEGPLDDAIKALQSIRDKYPELNSTVFAFGRLELTFKNGVLYSVGPNPHLVRGKDFHVSRKVAI